MWSLTIKDKTAEEKMEEVEGAKTCGPAKIFVGYFAAVSAISIGSAIYELVQGNTAAVDKLVGPTTPPGILILNGIGFGVASVYLDISDRALHALDIAKKYIRGG